MLSISHPALGVSPPCQSSWFSHQGMEKYCLPHAHVGGEVDVPVHQGHPVRQSGRLDTEPCICLEKIQTKSVLLVPVDKDVTSIFCAKTTVSVCYYVAQSGPLFS